MEENERLMSSTEVVGDEEESIRPGSLDEYIGQDSLKENLRIYIQAALQRNESLDHVLLYGPPGLGKTTLSYILSHEMHTNIKIITGPSISKSGDLASVLSTLDAGDILFIDEIHRLPKVVEEVLYPAMEDFEMDVMVGGEMDRVEEVFDCLCLHLHLSALRRVQEIFLLHCVIDLVLFQNWNTTMKHNYPQSLRVPAES